MPDTYAMNAFVDKPAPSMAQVALQKAAKEETISHDAARTKNENAYSFDSMETKLKERRLASDTGQILGNEDRLLLIYLR